MFSYIKSFFYSTTKKNTNTDTETPISLKNPEPTKKRNKHLGEKLMLIRHRTKKRLSENNFKWSIPGWSTKLSSHIDWSIKIGDKLTSPIIKTKANIGRYISANEVPINISNTKTTSLQQYLENFGQFNSNIKINYNLSSNYNESVRFTCSLVLLPKNIKMIYYQVKLLIDSEIFHIKI